MNALAMSYRVDRVIQQLEKERKHRMDEAHERCEQWIADVLDDEENADFGYLEPEVDDEDLDEEYVDTGEPVDFPEDFDFDEDFDF